MANEQAQLQTSGDSTDNLSLYQQDGVIEPLEPVGTTPPPEGTENAEDTDTDAVNKEEQVETPADPNNYEELERKMRQEMRQNQKAMQRQFADQIQRITDSISATSNAPVTSPEPNKFDELREELSDSDDYISTDKMLELLDAQQQNILGRISEAKQGSGDESIRQELEAFKQERENERFWGSYSELNPEVEKPQEQHNKLVQNALDRGMSEDYAMAYAHGVLDSSVDHIRKSKPKGKSAAKKNGNSKQSPDSTSGTSDMTPRASGTNSVIPGQVSSEGVFNDGLKLFTPGPQR